MHPTMNDFLEALRLKGRGETARTYGEDLLLFSRWLGRAGIDPLKATTDDLRRFQVYLADEHRSPRGELLSRGTQSRRVCAIRSYYRWMESRDLILVDVAHPLRPPRMQRAVTTSRDYLTVQEATALMQTQAAQAMRYPEGCWRWAEEVRDLAFLAVALSSGRRRGGLRHLDVAHLDFERNELRCEREKGKAGRVLPIAAWAMAVLRIYVERARPVLCCDAANPALFVGERTPRLGKPTILGLIERAHRNAVEANPDLVELAAKHLTTHCLRVSFATMLFAGGCGIRSINELMMHESLETTARYTPIPLEDLRRACSLAHPRA